MSRRKQSNPRQIKRTLGEMEEGDDAPLEDNSQSENEGGASEHEGGSVGGESPRSSSSGGTEAKEDSESPKEPEKGEVAEKAQDLLKQWNGPDYHAGNKGKQEEPVACRGQGGLSPPSPPSGAEGPQGNVFPAFQEASMWKFGHAALLCRREASSNPRSATAGSAQGKGRENQKSESPLFLQAKLLEPSSFV